MGNAVIASRTGKKIEKLVDYYVDNQRLFVSLLGNLQAMFAASKELQLIAHSVKFRIKDPDHLRDKLFRKAAEAQKAGKTFPYTEQNLFTKVNDLVGFRILHLYTHQIEKIHAIITELLAEQMWIQLEKPKARTWDDESREYFAKIGIATTNSKTMYTSVHYIVRPNTRSKISCEIQVRTLMEEVWGEVDHQINYPHPSDINSCREQIKVLARVTSSCSRLVDSIFLTHNEVRTPGGKKISR